jgi:RNA polymerase sigma-70 factor (ECF subfamily)
MTDVPVTAVDAPGLTRLYDEHARDLHRYLARRLTVSVADDLVAETFLVAWEQRARYDPGRGSPRAWLFGIATNLLRRHARTEAATLRALAKSAGRADTDTPADVPARVDADRAARGLAAGLAGLRAEERDVLLLVAWAGLRPVEIAAALSLDDRTVRTRLHRARTKLRDSLEETTDD